MKNIFKFRSAYEIPSENESIKMPAIFIAAYIVLFRVFNLIINAVYMGIISSYEVSYIYSENIYLFTDINAFI